MAVKYVEGGNNLFGTLGGLATIGGALTGAPWLSTMGTGLGMMGGYGKKDDSNMTPFEKILNGVICGEWYNPASGSIAKKDPNPQPSKEELSDEELMKKWNLFNTGGYQSWLR